MRQRDSTGEEGSGEWGEFIATTPYSPIIETQNTEKSGFFIISVKPFSTSCFRPYVLDTIFFIFNNFAIVYSDFQFQHYYIIGASPSASQSPVANELKCSHRDQLRGGRTALFV